MDEGAGCFAVVAGLILLALLSSAAHENGYDKGHRDAVCEASYRAAATAADSLTVSRGDERCAAMIQEAP